MTTMAGGAEITSPGSGTVILTFTSALLFAGKKRPKPTSIVQILKTANIDFFINDLL